MDYYNMAGEKAENVLLASCGKTVGGRSGRTDNSGYKLCRSGRSGSEDEYFPENHGPFFR